MTTQTIRDPKTDHLLTAENAALILIDYQPGLVDGTNSIRREALVNNVVALAKAAKMFDVPVILSTIAVEAGYQEPTTPELLEEVPGVAPIDRTAVNAWEQPEFRAAVEATGRRKLIIAGLWTEVCLVFPALDMLKEGYEVYAV
jgi:nicotinamidase-related amidase